MTTSDRDRIISDLCGRLPLINVRRVHVIIPSLPLSFRSTQIMLLLKYVPAQATDCLDKTLGEIPIDTVHYPQGHWAVCHWPAQPIFWKRYSSPLVPCPVDEVFEFLLWESSPISQKPDMSHLKQVCLQARRIPTMGGSLCCKVRSEIYLQLTKTIIT